MARLLEVQQNFTGEARITAEVTTEKELGMLGYRNKKPPKRYGDPLWAVRNMTVNMGLMNGARRH